MATVLKCLLDWLHIDYLLIRLNSADASRVAAGLPAQAEACDEVLVTRRILSLQIIEQLASLIDHAKQTTAGVMVFLVIGEMGSELIDTRRQKSNLNLRRASVGSSPTIFLDYFLFAITTDGHLVPPEEFGDLP